MTYTVKFSHNEIALLVDALKKAAARHVSYARYYPGRQRDKHTEMAAGMTQLSLRLQRSIRDR
jgi:hypothetical protein